MIYFIQSPDGAIKIGTSIRLTERIKQIAVDANIEVKSLLVLAVMNGAYAEEQAIHAKFEEYRIRGEWFKPNPELTSFMAMEGRPWNGRNDDPPNREMTRTTIELR